MAKGTLVDEHYIPYMWVAFLLSLVMACSMCVLALMLGEWSNFVQTVKVAIPLGGLLLAALLPAVVFGLRHQTEIMWLVTQACGVVCKDEVSTLSQHLPPTVERSVEASVKREMQSLQKTVDSIVASLEEMPTKIAQAATAEERKAEKAVKKIF